MLDAAEYPFIAANLDFSQVQLEEGAPAIRIGRDAGRCDLNGGKVVKSCWVRIGTERVGLIGRAPADFFNVIENPANTIPGLDFVGGRDEANQPRVSALEQVLEQVDALERRGVHRILLVDHAQDFAAGSTGFMAQSVAEGPFNLLRPGDSAEADYPTRRVDSEGQTVLVVNSDQLYRYVGNLIVRFDRDGHIQDVDERSGPVATTAEGVSALAAVLNLDTLEPDAKVAEVFAALKQTQLIQDAFFVVGSTDYPLNGQRADVRSRETNLGNLAAAPPLPTAVSRRLPVCSWPSTPASSRSRPPPR